MYFIIFGPLNSHCILVMMFISSIVYKKNVLPTLQIFWRMKLISAAYLLLTKQKIILKTSYPILSIVRVILHFLAFSFYFISLTYMSLAVATALYFSTPLFMSILAKFFLKEDIGIRRWLAILVSFIGIFVILNPDLSDFDFKNLLPVICALFYASSMTISKKTADKDNVHTQLFYFYILTVSICLAVFFLSGSGQFNKFDNPTMQFIFRDWFTNPTFTWKYIIVMGILASVAFTCPVSPRVSQVWALGKPHRVWHSEHALMRPDSGFRGY